MPYELIKDRYDVTEEFWNKVRPNLNVAADIQIWENICNNAVTPVMEDKGLTDLAASVLPPEPWDDNTFNSWLNVVKEKSGKKGKELFHPIRQALTALDNGPELKTLLPLIGYEKTLKRLRGETA